MAFCDQCGAHVGVDSEERYCANCGADQTSGHQPPGDVHSEPAFAAATPASSATWADVASQATTWWDDPRVRLTAVYVGAALAMVLAGVIGGLMAVALLLPLTIGVVIAFTTPPIAQRSLERFAAWSATKQSNARDKQTRVARWITRPYTGGIARIGGWTSRIEDDGTRCGVRAASYLYFSGLFVLAIATAAYVALAVVIAIILIIVSFWLLQFFLSDDLPRWSRSTGGSTAPLPAMPGTRFMKKGFFFDTPTGMAVNESGQFVKEGLFVDTPTGLKVDEDGRYVEEGFLVDTPTGYRLDEDGRLVQEGFLVDTPTGVRLNEDGDIVREGVFFDEQTGVRLDKT